MQLKYLLILIFSSFAICASAQSKMKSRDMSNQALKEVSKQLENNESDEAVAQGYEKVAKELVAKDQYAKAEEYLAKAKALYLKMGDKDKIALIEREIAKVQEAQNKIPEAISNFNAAANISTKSVQRSLNSNDALRLSKKSDPKAQKNYIQQNIQLLDQVGEQEEKAIAYRQLAQANIEMNYKEEALKDLGNALSNSANKPEQSFKINREIANIYASDNQHNKAIEINKELLAEAKKTQNTKVEIEQLQSLSTAYMQGDESQKAIETLRQSYSLALKEGHTLDAKKSVELIADFYKKEKTPQKALDTYADFVANLEPLIKSDSTLIDDKFFRTHENKIAQLEKERALKDELIDKSNTFNYVLTASIGVMLIFLLFIIRSWYSIRKKNKEIALQSLRREMNPHFIFNSLNSVNQFIAQNNELEANKYLSSYSKLMRNVMENSNKDFIALAAELDQLKEYLELEYMRFHDKFEYEISVDKDLDADTILVPNMLVQPQIENAIWHGLRYREDCGKLRLSVKAVGDKLCIIVDDNGIGLAKSKELKTKHQKVHHSRGLTNTYERIDLLNSLYNKQITIEIKDKVAPNTGVTVSLCFPLVYKKR